MITSPQRGRLTASAGAKKGQNFSLLHFKPYVIHRRDLAKFFKEILDLYEGHLIPPP